MKTHYYLGWFTEYFPEKLEKFDFTFGDSKIG